MCPGHAARTSAAQVNLPSSLPTLLHVQLSGASLPARIHHRHRPAAARAAPRARHRSGRAAIDSAQKRKQGCLRRRNVHTCTHCLTWARLRGCKPTKLRSAKIPCQGFCVPTDFRIAHESNETRTKDYKKKRDRAPVRIRMGRAASNGPSRPNRERGGTSAGGLWSGTPRHTHMPSSSKMTLEKSRPNGNPFLYTVIGR